MHQFSDGDFDAEPSSLDKCCKATGRAATCVVEFFKYIFCCDCFRSAESLQRRRQEDYVDIWASGDAFLTSEEMGQVNANTSNTGTAAAPTQDNSNYTSWRNKGSNASCIGR